MPDQDQWVELEVDLCRGCPLSTPGPMGSTPTGHHGVHVHLPDYEFLENPWAKCPEEAPDGTRLTAAERAPHLPEKVRVLVPTRLLGADGLPDPGIIAARFRDHPVWRHADVHAQVRAKAVRP